MPHRAFLVPPNINTTRQILPGLIDGAVNPEQIPDLIAYRLFLRLIVPNNAGNLEKSRVRAFAHDTGLSEPGVDLLLTGASDFQARVAVLDRQAAELKDRFWPNPTQDVIAKLTELENQKNLLLTEAVSNLHRALGPEGEQKLHKHVTGHVKRHAKVIPAPVQSRNGSR